MAAVLCVVWVSVSALCARLRALSDEYDILGFQVINYELCDVLLRECVRWQEVFSKATRDALISALFEAGCRYHVHFVAGIGLPSQFEGSGLLLVSRYRIVDVDYKR